FRLEHGLPVWRYEAGGFAFEKRVLLPHLQNTVHIHYRLVQGDGTVRLKLRPSVHFRPHEAPVSLAHPGPYTLTSVDDRYALRAPARGACRRCGGTCTAGGRPSRWTPRSSPRSPTASSTAAGTRLSAPSGARGTSAPTWPAGTTRPSSPRPSRGRRSGP